MLTATQNGSKMKEKGKKDVFISLCFIIIIIFMEMRDRMPTPKAQA